MITYLVFGGSSSFNVGLITVINLFIGAVPLGVVAGVRLTLIISNRRNVLLSRGTRFFYLFSIIAVIFSTVISGLMVVLLFIALSLSLKALQLDSSQTYLPESIVYFMTIGINLLTFFMGGSLTVFLGVKITAFLSRF